MAFIESLRAETSFLVTLGGTRPFIGRTEKHVGHESRSLIGIQIAMMAEDPAQALFLTTDLISTRCALI